MKRYSIWMVCLLVLLLGCGERELASKLDERGAAEIVVLLHRSGIEALREKVGTGRNESYRVEVHRADYARALEVLYEYGLPRRVSEQLSELTTPQGFLPASGEVNTLRIDVARSLQIEQLLSALPDVLSARVVINSGTKSTLFDQGVPPRATVVLRVAKGLSELQFSETKIRQMVAQTIPELAEDTVIVEIVPVLTLNTDITGLMTRFPPFYFKVPHTERALAERQVLAAMLAAGLFGGLVGAGLYAVIRRRRQKNFLPAAWQSEQLTSQLSSERSSRKPTLVMSAAEDEIDQKE